MRSEGSAGFAAVWSSSFVSFATRGIAHNPLSLSRTTRLGGIIDVCSTDAIFLSGMGWRQIQKRPSETWLLNGNRIILRGRTASAFGGKASGEAGAASVQSAGVDLCFLDTKACSPYAVATNKILTLYTAFYEKREANTVALLHWRYPSPLRAAHWKDKKFALHCELAEETWAQQARLRNTCHGKVPHWRPVFFVPTCSFLQTHLKLRSVRKPCRIDRAPCAAVAQPKALH